MAVTMLPLIVIPTRFKAINNIKVEFKITDELLLYNPKKQTWFNLFNSCLINLINFYDKFGQLWRSIIPPFGSNLGWDNDVIWW